MPSRHLPKLFLLLYFQVPHHIHNNMYCRFDQHTTLLSEYFFLPHLRSGFLIVPALLLLLYADPSDLVHCLGFHLPVRNSLSLLLDPYDRSSPRYLSRHSPTLHHSPLHLSHSSVLDWLRSAPAPCCLQLP